MHWNTACHSHPTFTREKESLGSRATEAVDIERSYVLACVDVGGFVVIVDASVTAFRRTVDSSYHGLCFANRVPGGRD